MNYRIHLKQDKLLGSILGDETYELKLHENIMLRLIQSIISQQLNTKVAKVIFDRFLARYENNSPSAQEIIKTESEQLKALGLSRAKTDYVQNAARFCIEYQITDKMLSVMSNDEIIELLTQIKGVGKWTIEMLLMFSLGREDVFAVDDLGIQQAMTRLYNLDSNDKNKMKAEMLQISAKWKPYRTYACLHLWKWKDNN